MIAEKIVVGLMQASSAVTALVGTRFFGSILPAGTAMPAIVYRKLGGTVRDRSLGQDATWIARAPVEVTIAASTYDSLKTLATAVRKAIDSKFDSTVAGEHLLAAEVEEEGEDDFDVAAGVHFQVWTFRIAYEEGT